jgi:YD repeat-containing protein
VEPVTALYDNRRVPNWNDRAHVALITTLVRNTRRPEMRAALERVFTPEVTLWDCNIYFTALALAWIQLFVVLGLLVIVVAAVSAQVDVGTRSEGAKAITFVGAFCLTGSIDAWWRLCLSWIGAGRLDRQRLRDGKTTLRLRRIATVPNHYLITLQVAVAVGLAAWVY